MTPESVSLTAAGGNPSARPKDSVPLPLAVSPPQGPHPMPVRFWSLAMWIVLGRCRTSPATSPAKETGARATGAACPGDPDAGASPLLGPAGGAATTAPPLAGWAVVGAVAGGAVGTVALGAVAPVCPAAGGEVTACSGDGPPFRAQPPRARPAITAHVRLLARRICDASGAELTQPTYRRHADMKRTSCRWVVSRERQGLTGGRGGKMPTEHEMRSWHGGGSIWVVDGSR